jgi:hypothetical protein
MPPITTTAAAGRTGRTAGAQRCIVVVVDLVSAEMDAYGPMVASEAQRYAARTTGDLDASGVGGVRVLVVALAESAVVAERAAPSGA